jgi:hypothetical protein
MQKAETNRDRLNLEDFATIFAHQWYRDFPLQPAHQAKAQRADWTIHLGVCVRSTADLMGLFCRFEAGGRTDAVVKDASGLVVAALEWEWIRLGKKPNELKKLKENCLAEAYPGLQFACLIGYSREPEAVTDLAFVASQWSEVPIPLLLVVVQFQWRQKERQFQKMILYRFHEGNHTILREQPAYPWQVEKSRWWTEAIKSG